MIKSALCIFLFMTAIFAREGIADMNYRQEPNENEVFIGHPCIEVPLERMLLIRKDNSYCAVKFLRYWAEIDEERMEAYSKAAAAGPESKRILENAATKKYAIYEAYYQGDGSGDFSTINVIKSEDIASYLPTKGLFRPFIYQPGNPFIKCGPIKLTWQFKKNICFNPPDKGRGDYGFELSPTPWTDISQVNAFDPRVKWYKYDEKRKWIYMPINDLWKDQ